jgi:hypothetical protein
MNPEWQRPRTAAEVAAFADNGEAFGRAVRDWQHELRKVHNRAELLRNMETPPVLLKKALKDHGQADAYLAAYVEWLCEQQGVTPPSWVKEGQRRCTKAFYDIPEIWMVSLAHAPGSFRRRGVFTVPENPITLSSGRPAVSDEQKRAKRCERQKRYRKRIRQLLSAVRKKNPEGGRPLQRQGKSVARD